MPRSGSTLAESIISMNKDVADLGESNIFEKSFKSEALVIKFLLTLTTSPFFNNGLLGDIPDLKSSLNFF